MKGRTFGIACVSAVLVAGAPAAEASGLLRLVARYCLRNVGVAFTCYVFGRSGELIVDNSLTSAWNHALAAEKKPSDPGKAEDKGQSGGIEGKQGPGGMPKLLPAPQGIPGKSPTGLARPVIESLGQRELGSLAAELVRQGQLKGAGGPGFEEGVLIYAPLPQGRGGWQPRLAPGPSGSPLELPKVGPRPAGPGAATAPPSTTPSPPLTSLSPRPTELTCRGERERALGLSRFDIIVAGPADRERLNRRRLGEVILPCMGK
ncbi:MAG: hypothetical protein KJZ80_20595 [Hyphomicrobiaceae bacterium]|nr:hypothetical protein [Hyphomicrobiaceae bacterium]